MNDVANAKRVLNLVHGVLPLPIYLPDATLGVVRAVDATDLEQAGIEAVVMNVFHLMQKPGTATIQALGGLHRMAHWPHPIITDSGGFQAYSLVRQNPKFGKLNDHGIRFKPEGAERDYQLTPEKSVQLQLAYGADIVICLDDCTHTADPPAEQELSVRRTIKWAQQCKREFTLQLKQRKIAPDGLRPLLFGVVQGGADVALRRRCAEALLEIGFDGYGYGGWPLDSNGQLLIEMLHATREMIPTEYPMHALGIGSPDSVVACARMGYAIFDCALPTRDARNGRLYVWNSDPNAPDFTPTGKWHDTLYIDDEKHIRTDRPISPRCDCATCTRYAVGYLRHLRKCGETLYFRLATLHNLRFMTQLIAVLRATDHRLDAERRDWMDTEMMEAEQETAA
jgi:queuine tRNA-ribosyltransferase